MFTTTEVGQHRVLDFDIENRPLSYLGDEFTTAEITAIAWSWVGQERVHCKLLTLDPSSYEEMIDAFLKAYDQADIVTGHYIRRHDLPIINGALLELGRPSLPPKLSSDTKMDLVRALRVSRSQESLSAMCGLPHPKHHMTQAAWRAANRLTPEGLRYTRKRVVDDVIQHKAMRAALIEAGQLGPAKVWAP